MATFLTVLLVIVSIALIVVVLLQSGKSAGLSGAISGEPSSFLKAESERA